MVTGPKSGVYLSFYEQRTLGCRVLFASSPQAKGRDWVFSIREFRKVSLGETVSWNGRTYLVCNNYGLTLKRHTIEIRTHLQGETQAFFAGRTISLTDIGSTESLNLKAA